MLIDLREIKRHGKTEESFFFEYVPETELSGIPETFVKNPVKVEGTCYLIGEHSAELSGEITFVLDGECTRCLAHAEREYVVSFDESAGEDGYPVVNDKIDLGKIVDDTVIMNMPVKFLCKEDCKGICAGCGVNLNNAECKCKNKEGK